MASPTGSVSARYTHCHILKQQLPNGDFARFLEGSFPLLEDNKRTSSRIDKNSGKERNGCGLRSSNERTGLS